MHTFCILNEKQGSYSVNIQTLQAKASRSFKMDLGGSPHCVCTILRPTMAHHKVHTLGHFSSIQWPGNKSSYIHVHIYDVCFTCMNWHKKQHNQTNHQYQHVVAVEKNSTVITCTWTPCNRWSVESMQKKCQLVLETKMFKRHPSKLAFSSEGYIGSLQFFQTLMNLFPV